MQMIDVPPAIARPFRMVIALIDAVLIVVADVEDLAATLAIPIVVVVRLGAVSGLMDFRPSRSIAGTWIAVFVQLLVG